VGRTLIVEQNPGEMLTVFDATRWDMIEKAA